MKLRALLAEVDAPSVVGETDLEISGLSYDSRVVEPGFLFAALRGRRYDGHAFIHEAVQRGAVALLVDRPVPAPAGVTTVRVAQTRRALAQVSAAFAGHPSRRLRVVGVTGTNGKGATTYLIEAILRRAGRPCGIIGTMGIVIDGEVLPSARTTPEAPELQAALCVMAERSKQYVAVEVASHALAQERTTACRIEVAVFTNLTRDHLDFHRSVEAYRAAKARLFAVTEPSGWAVLNADDPASAVMRAVTPSRIMTYGLRERADVRGRDVVLRLDGSDFVAETPGGSVPISLRLAGGFNVANALAALAVGVTQDVPLGIMAEALAAVPGIPGRFERIDEGQPFAVVVDYAHTPDGLENVLRTAREVTRGHLITVFGCGGDRDRPKRPLMGRIAAEWSDYVIVTSDNPRTEDPLAIIEEIRRGVEEAVAARIAGGGRPDRVEVIYEPDRRRAIAAAVAAAGAGDMVVVAGKGHEAYQEIAGVRHPFDDRDVVREVLRARSSPRATAAWRARGPEEAPHPGDRAARDR
ncbi:MAG: UDP-N-acetylmuramoyl-L-alanyl-D-glutamate--2,6-diaminopimelate ligase [Armatimonadota bacterium]|nr:UDP-N-acetylmuramoyl-L-alanyl-D-glutamate--2,6-diaminopimelate ligase [Armatimonadota bacterium]